MSMKKEKKVISFKMPHLLFLMVGLMIAMSFMTYILPTGEYMELNGVQQYVAVDRTPVTIVHAFMLIFDGIKNSATVIALLLMMGGSMAIILGTKAIDRLVDYAMYQLQDKGSTVLIPCMFALLAFVGGFAVEGAIALFPLGILVAKKLKLDPLAAAGITVLAALVGWASSPASCYVAQLMIGVPMYSGFGVRFLNLTLCVGIGSLFVLIYAKKVEKDPTRSGLGHTEWLREADSATEKIEKKELRIKDLIIGILFCGQFALYLYLMLVKGLGIGALPAVMFPAAVICGLINGEGFDQIGKTFEEGTKDMSFLCVLIGLAGVISLIMQEGKIVATITYYLSLPLKSLSSGFATVGISAVIGAINFLVPSASAKAAALIPIIKPMAETLNISPQLAVQAFQVGDGFMNILSPFNGVTLAGIAIAKVPFSKWVKWVLPLMGVYYLVEFVILFVLSGIGWS